MTTRPRPTSIGTQLLTTERGQVCVAGAKTNGAFFWQITPGVLSDAMAQGGEVAKRAFKH